MPESPSTRVMRVLSILLALGVGTGLLTACSDPSPADADGPAVESPLPTVSPEAEAARGTLVSKVEFPDVDPTITAVGATSYRVVYRSTSGTDGAPTEVSGVVFVPTAPAPAGGRPVVTVGHGTTGVTAECGPSLYPDLLGYASTIVPLMKLGYVAVMTDYQGLGSPGPGESATHPYLEPNTSAFNLIDGVRAARAVTPDASDRWAALGVSQGGQAAWSAAELAGSYGTGLNFVGSVALAPAADITEEATLAASQFLTREQQVTMPFLIHGLRTAHPEIQESDYLHGVLAQNPAAWLSCTGPLLAERASLAPQINPSDSTPKNDAARKVLADWLATIELPKRQASGPLLVVNGDADQTVRPQWVQSAVDKACKLGDSVQHIVRAGQGHGNLDPGAETAIWLDARFRGDPAPSDCAA